MKKTFIVLFCIVFVYCQKHTISGYSITQLRVNDSYDDIPELMPLDRAKTYTLRLLRVIDNRLPDLSDEKYKELFKEIESVVREYLGFKIQIVSRGKKDILEYFNSFKKYFDNSKAKPILSTYINVTTKEGKKRLMACIKSVVDTLGDKIKNYVSPDISNSKIKVINYLYNNFLIRLNEIMDIQTANGKFYTPDYANTQSYVHWDIIAHHINNADIVITNTMIASADSDMPIYVILRGGITSGFVEDNFHNYPVSGVCIVGLFQFLSDAPFFLKYRGKIPAGLLIKVIAMMVGHEMGHLLLRYKEMYEPFAGIHMTAVDLNYLKWYQRVFNMKNLHPIRNIDTVKKF